MMSWLGVFYVAYRLIKEQMEAERIRREHPYRTPNPDLDDPRNDEPFFTWEQQNPELVKVRQRKAKERLEQVLGGMELRQARYDKMKTEGTFTESDKIAEQVLQANRERYIKMIEEATKMGI